MANSTKLSLPLVAASQAQKHVTVNESLLALDVIVQLSVRDRDLATPPGSPAEGDVYIVAASPTGAWAGQGGKLAAYQNAGWTIYTPKEGWVAWVMDEDLPVIHNGTTWFSREDQLLLDGTFRLKNSSDNSKQAAFLLSEIAAGTTRTYTLPNVSSELVTLAGNQTFTGTKVFRAFVTLSNSDTTVTDGQSLTGLYIETNDSNNPGMVAAQLEYRGTGTLGYVNTVFLRTNSAASNVLKDALVIAANGDIQLFKDDGTSIAVHFYADTGRLAITSNGSLELPDYTAAELALLAAPSGAKAFCRDATATTFASVVAGGGANFVPVYCDGTNWRIG